MLQALRNCILGAGAKMSDPIRKQITATLEGFLSSTDDTTRTTAAACLGALCTCLKPDELVVVLHIHILGMLFCSRQILFLFRLPTHFLLLSFSANSCSCLVQPKVFFLLQTAIRLRTGY